MAAPAHASHRARPSLALALALVPAVLGSAGCLNPIELEPTDSKYRAVIRWTGNGIPHILADDLASAAYGQGYAFARLNGCVLADQILKVRSERSMFLGAGDNDVHISSDLVIKALRIYENAEEGFAEITARAEPEDGDPDPGARRLVDAINGYADGYNDFIEARGSELPCGEEPWLRPVTPTDLWAYYIDLGMLASSRQAYDFIWAADPPPSVGEPGEASEPGPGDDFSALARLREQRPGSNGWGIGAERSENGHGMLLANPHFPWHGELKLFESQLTVPGELNVYGAGLMGVVGTLIGFNENVAWTHTVSDGQRLTVYALTLDPGNALRYMHDGESKAMTSETHEVMVLGEDGETLTPASHTFYRSHHGLIVALPPLIWTDAQAYAIRDANANNQAMLFQFLGMAAATDMDDFQRVHDEAQGIPWVNTISTSRDGRAWYIDATPTPNLSQEAIDYWLEARETDFITNAVDQAGLVLLPGDSSTFDWVEVPGSRDPGLIPTTDVPRIERADFVFNANDSHWLSNPLEPLTGFSPLHGFESTPRTPRTRQNARVLLDEERRYSGSDYKFNLDELRTAALNNESMMAHLLLDAVVARCQGVTTVSTADHGTIDISEACAILAGWDGTFNVDSVGAVVWREFLGEFTGDELTDRGQLFAELFDPASPVDTPRGLSDSDAVLEAIAGAMVKLLSVGIRLDTPLGEAQYTVRAGQRIPIHGGGANEGVTNLIICSSLQSVVEPTLDCGTPVDSDSGTDLGDRGYVVNYGTSFIMTMQFTDDAPEAYSFITYGQSDDPRSPYHIDQTERFSAKDWRQVLFTEEDIEADPDLEVEVIFGFE